MVFSSQSVSFFLSVLLICSGIPETPRFPPLSYLWYYTNNYYRTLSHNYWDFSTYSLVGNSERNSAEFRGIPVSGPFFAGIPSIFFPFSDRIVCSRHFFGLPINVPAIIFPREIFGKVFPPFLNMSTELPAKRTSTGN